jgi:hypothetical protein
MFLEAFSSKTHFISDGYVTLIRVRTITPIVDVSPPTLTKLESLFERQCECLQSFSKMSDGLKIREISPELLDYAKKELGEEPKRRADDVRAIREWLKKQPHINADPDDQMIITFLRGCKFRMEKTKQKLDMYYTMRTMCPELMGNRDLRADAMKKCVKVK